MVDGGRASDGTENKSILDASHLQNLPPKPTGTLLLNTVETLLEPRKSPEIPATEPPGFIEQAARNGWTASLFNFGKADHPQVDYFNCGVVERPDGLWLVTRRSVWNDRLVFGFNDVVGFRLGGKDGLTPQIGYKLQFKPTAAREQIEDPRAIYHAGKTWVTVCNFVWFRTKKWTGAHQTLFEVDNTWTARSRHDIPYGKNGKGIGLNQGMEKNWLFFFHEDKLNLIYAAQPHTVVEFDTHMRVVAERRTEAQLPWAYGEIRGGTPPVRVGDEYVTFFHSSLPWTNRFRRYFMGAYAFQARSPFAITRITSKPLLTGSQNDPWVDKKPLVVFPCGALLRDEQWLVSFGVNDMKSAYALIPHTDLLHRMVWVLKP